MIFSGPNSCTGSAHTLKLSQSILVFALFSPSTIDLLLNVKKKWKKKTIYLETGLSQNQLFFTRERWVVNLLHNERLWVRNFYLLECHHIRTRYDSVLNIGQCFFFVIKNYRQRCFKYENKKKFISAIQ